MRFWKKTRGAISIFLVIILLPTMTMAGLFLDISRVKMAEEVVATSADLAINTVLSEYDKNLKDYFGLLASCQNTKDVIDISKQYFVDSMVSAGMSTSAAETYADNIMDAFVGDEDIRDMLQLSIDGDVKIQASSNGAMNNPALLKEGIVEFMKYRAPVNGAASLFEKLTNSEVTEQVQNASKETTMIEKREAFFEAEKKLIKQAEKAYKAIKKYENFTTWTGNKIVEEAFIGDMSTFLAKPDSSGDDFRTVFKNAHTKMVMNLYNTHNSDETYSITLLKKTSITPQGAVTTYSENNRPSADDIQSLINDFNTKLVNYINAQSNLNTAWNKVGKKLSSDYPIQYWVQLTNKCSSSYGTYVSATQNVWKAANKLENAVQNAESDVMNTLITKPANSYVSFTVDATNKLSMQSAYDVLIEKYNSSYRAEVTGGGSSAYKNINTQITSVDTQANAQKLRVDSVSNIFEIRNKVNKYQKDFDDAKALAKTAKDETNKLKNLLKKYKEAFSAWKTAAFDSELNDSELACNTTNGDRKQIQELEATGIEKFSEQSVTDLTTRLGNIETLCKTFRDDLKEIKYKNTKVINISNFTKFYNAANLNSSKIVRTESTLKEYCNSSFSFSIGTEIQRIEIKDNRTSTDLDDGDAYVITDSYHPNIQKTSLELYEWMKKTFDKKSGGANTLTASQTGFDVTDESSAESANSTMESKSEDASGVNTEGNAKAKNFKDWTGATLPSKDKGAPEAQTVTAKISEVATFASKIFSNFSETFSNSVKNTRDDIFMVDYLMSMFTYDTFNNEGYYGQLSDEAKNSINAVNASSKYTDTIKNNWESSDDYKTLTLTPRDSKNHWAYGGEIEYILYGNDTDAANKTAAYAQIYMIRYAMDVSAVFQNYWDDPILVLVADTLQALAYIPASLTKTLACLAITAAEAGVDIATLKQGIPVVLWKTDDDLVCNYENVFKGTAQGTAQSITDDMIALQYSDYLKIFIFIKLIGQDENLIYARTGDVIQANMTLASGKSDYALSKAKVFYDLDAKVLVEPMWSRLLAIDSVGDLTTQNNWRTIHVKIKRGY